MSDESAASDRIKAAVLEVARITSEAVRRENAMWLRFTQQVKEITRAKR